MDGQPRRPLSCHPADQKKRFFNVSRETSPLPPPWQTKKTLIFLMFRVKHWTNEGAAAQLFRAKHPALPPDQKKHTFFNVSREPQVAKHRKNHFF
ncbi:MAG: hypothetical protein MPJ79_00555 [Alphaproteobacteria bacterium]|nr:hypothetical protein [Alphaproteobacteria bacterium]